MLDRRPVERRAEERQPCAELLRGLAATGYQGVVVAEVNTRRVSREGRMADLAETLAFARDHLSAVTLA